MSLPDPQEETELREAVSAYLADAFEVLVEQPTCEDVGDPWDEAVAVHVQRNDLLLKEPPSHDQNDHRACLQARLLNIVREKRLNKNRGEEMRDNIRQLFEINSELQAIITQTKHESQRPTPLFCNAKEFHDESYQLFLEDMKRLKPTDSESKATK